MSALIFIALLSLLPVSESEPDILFSKHQSLGGDIDTVEIWLKGTWKDGKQASPQYVLRRTVSYQPSLKLPAKWQAQKTILWSSDATCPQALGLLQKLDNLQMPAVKIDALPSEEIYGNTVRADGAVYRLLVPGRYPSEPGNVDLTFGVDTPVANWVDDSFRTLASCWKSKRPESAE